MLREALVTISFLVIVPLHVNSIPSSMILGRGGGGGGGALVSPLPTTRSTPEWSQEEIKEGGNI